MAAEWAGFTTVAQCEIADYPTKVLEKHWPEVTRFRDVRDITRFSVRQAGIDPDGITLLSGGFPCQPHSLAGKRKASADERDLWGEFARVICELGPWWVLAENVPGLLSSENGRFFGRVLRDLAEMGYRFGWASYGACDVGANHKRERVFIVGWNTYRKNVQAVGEICKRAPAFPAGDCGDVAYPNGSKWRPQCSTRDGLAQRANGISQRAESSSGLECSGEDVADADKQRLQARIKHGGYGISPEGQEKHGCEAQSGGNRARAGWWLIEPDVGRVANGVPSRVDRLKCLGNAVVPHQVYQILRAIADIERGGA